MKCLIMSGILVVASIAATGAAAQDAAAVADEEGICLPVLYGWIGTPADAKQIKDIPVPDGFRTGRGGGCGGFIRADFLIRWHLRYGSEETVLQALDFIEQRDGATDALATRLDRSVNSGLVELAKEFREERREKDSRLDAAQPNALRAFIAQSPSVGKLREIDRDLALDLLDRIDLYLSAAETFASQRFAARARTMFTRYEVIEKRLLPTRDGSSAKLDPLISQALEYVQDSSSRFLTAMEIDLRLAVLDAQMSPDPATLDRARQVLKRHHQPAYANAPNVAFGGGDDFCDLRDENFLNEWERQVAEGCKDDDEFVNRAMAYGYADAMLAILTDANQRGFGKWDWEEYVVLREKELIQNSLPRDRVAGEHARVIMLKLAVADRHVAKVKTGANRDRNWSLETAWRLLAELVPLANPAENPLRFRQIAERAIAVDAEMRETDEVGDTRNTQLLAYYRLNLQNLDALAAGEVP